MAVMVLKSRPVCIKQRHADSEYHS
jgi:hypothetical protein